MRTERLSTLRQIIIEQEPTQQDLIRVALAERGFFISRAQLCRDMARVHAYKQNGRYLIVDDPRFIRTD